MRTRRTRGLRRPAFSAGAHSPTSVHDRTGRNYHATRYRTPFPSNFPTNPTTKTLIRRRLTPARRHIETNERARRAPWSLKDWAKALPVRPAPSGLPVRPARSLRRLFVKRRLSPDLVGPRPAGRAKDASQPA